METTKEIKEDRIKLNVGMTGKYGWEITCYGDCNNNIIEKIKDADDKLKEQFKNDGT